MDLRALRQEVQNLPEINDHLETFQQHWLKPLRANSNNHLPFLQHLPPDVKKELKLKLELFQEHFHRLQKAQSLQERIRFSLRQIIELKLTTLNGDAAKGQMIVNNLLHDDFMNLQKMIAEVRNLEDDIQKAEKVYDDINSFLQKNLLLEESVGLMGLPHKKHFHSFVAAAQQQKTLVRRLGNHFVELAKETQRKKK
ncbi:MAG: hypothetical protein Q8R37_05420 [Nanoarchaeota archaeon]|nr:hypothetical protein [Nanoarchaeota archaeon]